MIMIRPSFCALVLMVLLTGCGKDFEWFPENNGATKEEPAAPTTATETVEMGRFVSSTPRADLTFRGFEVVTEKGTFLTFEPLDVPKDTPVVLERVTDLDTKLLVGQLLAANGKKVLVYMVVKS